MMLTTADKDVITALKQGAKLRTNQKNVGKAVVITNAFIIKNPYIGKAQTSTIPVTQVYKLLKADVIKVGMFPWMYELTKKGIEA